MRNSFFNKNVILYLLRFIICFCVLYYGTFVLIGLATPGGYYSPFVHDYFNYIGWLRFALLYCSKIVLSLLGYNTFIYGFYSLRTYNGPGVHLVYSCIGYGIMSFWIAFIFANEARWQKKTKWIVAGLLSIFIINVVRISLLLIAVNNKWPNHFNLDNHTLFNIAAYILIFILIYFFDKSQKNDNKIILEKKDDQRINETR
jgi:exosortase/archaeosortase family protein